MSTPVFFELYDAANAPLTGVVGSFVLYKDKAGAARTPPSIVDLGGGQYQFTPSDDDEAVGTVALLGTGAYPGYMAFAIHKPDNTNQFWLVYLEDATGAPWTGSAPTIGDYRSAAGVSLLGTAPSVVTITGTGGALVFAITPSASDVIARVGMRVDAPASAYPDHWHGQTSPVGLPPAPPATAVPPSTFQQSLNGEDTPILWADYQEDLAPPWLRAGFGKTWLRGVGDMKDALEVRVRDSVNARLPEKTALDGLGYLAHERGLEQGVTEATTAFRARLRAAWDVWPWAGTAQGVLRALWYAGFTNAWLITGTGLAHGLDGSQNVVTTPYTGTLTVPSGFWNGFRVIFPAPLKASWVPTPPGNTSDEVNTIRRLVKRWKAGHALFEDMVVVTSGLIWGFPPTQLWGGGGLVWGGATTVWTPD